MWYRPAGSTSDAPERRLPPGLEAWAAAGHPPRTGTRAPRRRPVLGLAAPPRAAGAPRRRAQLHRLRPDWARRRPVPRTPAPSSWPSLLPWPSGCPLELVAMAVAIVVDAYAAG